MWRTLGSSIVLAEIGATRTEGDQVYADMFVLENFEELTKQLGYSKLSRKLYRELGIDMVTLR